MIPEEAFEDILFELERLPLAINNYRKKVGEGRSQAFGVVGKRGLPPDYSRQCWFRPYLYKLLLDFGEKYVTDISWNAITLNQNYSAGPHYDRHNRGDSYLVAFGEYTGGDLKIHEGDLSGNHNICGNPIVTDFSKVLHSVEPFEGYRCSLVYYFYEDPRSVPLPPSSVRCEDGDYFFYRGEQKVTQKEGLPHPLRGRKKNPKVSFS